MEKQAYLIEGNFNTLLSKNIQKEYNKLMATIEKVPAADRSKKCMAGTGGAISIRELIAYQIGWGLRLIDWYETGLKGQLPVMPGDGFTKWSYTDIAEHFYKTYQSDTFAAQAKYFERIVRRIIEIAEQEYETGRLDKEDVWKWATLDSGKYWPLSKWIQVNTVAPYKRAIKMLRASLLNFSMQ